MKNKLFLLLLFSIFAFNSCDILRSSHFEVISWTPGNGYHFEPEKIIVSLDFSHDPDKASVERNFSLNGNGNRIRGSFLWNGKKMIFIPLSILETNVDYTISLTSDVRNTKGLSMDEAFYCDFTTRPDNIRPVLNFHYPEMYALIDDQRTKIILEFSVPVTLRTLYENVSFSPSMTGFWSLENEDKLAVFEPSELWLNNSRYEMRISSSLTGCNGMSIENDFLSIFTVGTDRENPYLLNAHRITKNGDIFQLNPDNNYNSASYLPVENHDWEKDDKLLLVFSKPVDSVSVRNYISAEDGPNLVLESVPGFNNEIILKFENIPAYESRFTFRIRPGIKDRAGNESKDEYIFRVFANGKYSKPPALAGIRMPMAPANAADHELKYFDINSIFENIPIKNENYPSGESVMTWIELYFFTAEGAAVDPFSVMELFRIDTSNNVISFSARHVKTNNFTIANPQGGLENLQRIEITGNLVNSTSFGIINFQIASGLRDSLGNQSEKLFRISLIK